MSELYMMTAIITRNRTREFAAFYDRHHVPVNFITLGNGTVYKVKTFQAMTKLEKNGLFLYESVPGTSVHNFCESESGISFTVEGSQDAQITVGTEDDCEYEVIVAGESAGVMKTNLSGKLSISVELEGSGEVAVKIIKK